jgi:PEP-CTERM motif-containing protein
MLPRNKLLLSLTMLGFALSAPRAEATILVIDSFNGPDINAPDNPTLVFLPANQSTTQGQRVSTINNGTMASSIGNLTVAGDGATGTITWTPVDELMAPSSLDLRGGVNDKFALDIGAFQGLWNASIVVNDGTNHNSGMHEANGGTVFFLFSDFDNTPVDFTAVKTIQLILANELQSNLVADASNSITIGELRAVPEPSTAGMLLLGLLGLARAGRRGKLHA